MSSFQECLEEGKAGESAIAHWFRRKGYTILPVYEKIINEGKGPQLYMPGHKLIAPDMFVFKGDNAYWIEAKHKTAFAWYRKHQCWTTGIDLTHYEHYLDVDDLTPWPVWLMFLHKGGQAKDSPANSPSGLFGNTLSNLRNNEDHRWIPDNKTSWRHYSTGMVYWNIDALKRFASLKEVYGTLSAAAD